MMSHLKILAISKNADGIESFLASALAQILDLEKGITQASVFRVVQDGFVLWHSTSSQVQQSKANVASHELSIEERIGEKEASLPLIANDEAFALLHLDYETAPDTNFLRELSQELAFVLYTRQLDNLFRQQTQISSRLNQAESLKEVVEVLAASSLEAKQFIAVSVFDYDESNKIRGGHVVITANRQQSYQNEEVTGMPPSDLEKLKNFIRQDGDFYIFDLDSFKKFEEDSHIWLKKQKAKSLYFLPLWLDKRLYAFMTLVDMANALGIGNLERQFYKNIISQASNIIEKRQFLEEAQKATAKTLQESKVLQTLNKLIATANTATTEAPILQETSDALLKVTGVDHVGIVLIENERGFVVSEAPVSGILGFEVESGEGSIAELIKEQRKALIIDDVESDTQMPYEARKVMQDLGIKSVMILPMFDLNGRLLGTVGLDYYNKQTTIDPNVVEIAQTFVSQVALSLQKLRLLAESQQQAQQLQKVTDFGQALRAYLSVPEIISNALRYSRDLVNADYVGIFLVHGIELRRVGTYWGGKAQVDSNGETVTAESDNLAAQVLENQKILKVDEIQSDWVSKHPLDNELQSFLIAPVISAGKVLGIFELGSKNPRAYNAVDIAAVQQMSNQLAIALSNANAYAQSQRLARNKDLANEIIAKLQRQSDVRDILEVTVQELGQALGAKRGRIRLGTGDKAK